MRRYGLTGYGMVMAVALLLTGCRGTDTEEPDVLSRFNADGTAWLSVQIHAGSGSGNTRTVTGYEDGNEYDIDDVYILFFSGQDEATATFASAYKTESSRIANPSEQGIENPSEQSEQVTEMRTVLISNANIARKDNLYAFALVNNNPSVMTATMATGSEIRPSSATSLTFANGGQPITIDNSSTLADLQRITVSDYKRTEDGRDYYLMTNAPLWSKPGGATDPTEGEMSTLERVPYTAFYGTEAEATAHPGIDIFVERAAAKIEVGLTAPTDGIPIASNEKLKIQKLEVAIDRYNTVTTLVRRVGRSEPGWVGLNATDANASGRYRAVDDTNLRRDPERPAYRTHWAEDVNYSGDALSYTTLLTSPDEADFRTLYEYDSGEGSYLARIPNAFYVMENTFELDHQELECSTQLLFRAQVNSNTFYTIDSTGEEFGDVAGAPSEEHGTSASSSFARRGTRTEGQTPIDEYLRNWLMDELEAVRVWVHTYADGDPSYIVLTPGDPDEEGKVTITASQTRCASGSTGYTAWAKDDGTKKAIEDKLGTLTIKMFRNGYCYYRLPIRHFTDAETPWELVKEMQNVTVSTIYLGHKASADTADKNNYLGRYGVVRNNWYTVTVTGISRIGSPTPQALDGTNIADDNPSNFVSLKISVLPWIEHGQTINNKY